MLTNNRVARTCTFFRMTIIWEGAICSDSPMSAFKVEPCVLAIWHQSEKNVAVDIVVLPVK